VRIGGPIVSGKLGGDRFQVDLAKVRLATLGGSPLRASPLRAAPLDLGFPLPGLARQR
jgi:hypothetical protein